MATPYERHVERLRPQRRQHAAWTGADGPMPAVYLGHGAPPLLDDDLWMTQLADWASALPRPTAILVVSAHWETAPIAVSSPAADTPLVYDFAGFDERFYRLRYPTPDSSWLAKLVAGLLPARTPLHRHPRRGLDHGAWVPLLAMYPQADIPVLQLSLPTHDPQQLLDIGARLREIRDHGVLLMGSGFLTHGLPYLSRQNWMNPHSRPPAWSMDFDAWADDALRRGDIDTLLDYERAPGMPYAHPTVEHLIPLFITLGAAIDPGPPEQVIDGYFMGLSKRSIQVA